MAKKNSNLFFFFFGICIFLATASVFFDIAAARGFNIRPDILMYPLYKTSVESDENRLKSYVDLICMQARCQNQYTVKVFKWSLFRYHSVYMIWQTKTIFVKQDFIENFDNNEQAFIMGHELGHQILKTMDEKEADSFAAKHSKRQTGQSALRKTSFLPHIKGNSEIQKHLQERVKALEIGKGE